MSKSLLDDLDRQCPAILREIVLSTLTGGMNNAQSTMMRTKDTKRQNVCLDMYDLIYF